MLGLVPRLMVMRLRRMFILTVILIILICLRMLLVMMGGFVLVGVDVCTSGPVLVVPEAVSFGDVRFASFLSASVDFEGHCGNGGDEREP